MSAREAASLAALRRIGGKAKDEVGRFAGLQMSGQKGHQPPLLSDDHDVQRGGQGMVGESQCLKEGLKIETDALEGQKETSGMALR
jgi:hypothetical protein